MFAFFSPLPWLCAPVPSPLNLSASLGPSARHGPRIYRAPLACECAKLFGCGIFPHTGSRQSRLTGHWLHSITERPGLEKKKSLKSDRCPAWNRAPPPPLCTLHTTTRGGETAVSSSPREEQECAVTGLYSGEPLAHSLHEQQYTTCDKATDLSPHSSVEDTMDWQIAWE